jgi:hypothetical protein
MRYSISEGLDSVRDERSEPIIIITEEGMVGSLYHNGRCIEVLLWRGYRADKYEFTDAFWDNLSDMPSEVHTFEGESVATKSILDWCVFRLCMFCPTYEFVDWDELVSDYNKGSVLTDTFDGILDAFVNGDGAFAWGVYGKLTDAEKEEFMLYVETLKHYEVENQEEMEKELFKLLKYLNK